MSQTLARQRFIQEFQDTLAIAHNLATSKSIKYSGLLQDYVPSVAYDQTSVSIQNTDCLLEAIRLKNKNKTEAKIGILNMASDICPGGGVRKGSQAQEEDICRRTTLYPSLYKHMYPLHPLEIIWNPDVVIIKTPDFAPIPLSEATSVAMVSMAAIRRPCLTKTGGYSDNDHRLMHDKVRMVLQTAHYHGLDTLVLGAWGCGAFKNPPKEVAMIFKGLLYGEFHGVFRHVSFAIMEKGPHEPLGGAFREVFL